MAGQAANDDPWVARAYEGRPSGFKGATRRPATAVRASLDPGDHFGPADADTTGQAPGGTRPATAPPSRHQAHQSTEHRHRKKRLRERAGPNLLYIIKTARPKPGRAHALQAYGPARTPNDTNHRPEIKILDGRAP